MRHRLISPPPPASRPGSECDRRWNHNVRYWGYGYADLPWKIVSVLQVICTAICVLAFLAFCVLVVAKLLGYDV